MKSSLQKVIMSKKVAKTYLEKVSTAASTLTVYFTDERQLREFMSEVKSECGKRASCSRGFDYVTFLTTEDEAAETIHKLAQNKGLDSSGF